MGGWVTHPELGRVRVIVRSLPAGVLEYVGKEDELFEQRLQGVFGDPNVQNSIPEMMYTREAVRVYHLVIDGKRMRAALIQDPPTRLYVEQQVTSIGAVKAIDLLFEEDAFDE